MTNGPWTGRYRVGQNLKLGRRPLISRADVAQFLLAQFLLAQISDDTYLGKAPAIGY